MTKRTRFNRACQLPVLGRLLRVANGYVFSGDHRSGDKLAPLWLWVRAFAGNISIALGLTYLAQRPSVLSAALAAPAEHPATLILNVFPGLVGFGIGAYALVFMIPKELIQKINAAALRRGKGSGLIVNSELGFPLIVLVLCIGVAALCQLYDTAISKGTSWFCFWFSWLMVVEVVSALFKLGEAVLVEHLSGQGESTPK